MPKYRVKYASAGGSVSGIAAGQLVTLTDTEEAAHLLALGLIEEEGGEDAKPSKPAGRQPAKR